MNWKLLVITYGMLFLAELGDRTQIAVFTLAARYKALVLVFLGASFALVTVTFIAVTLAQTVTKYVPTHWPQTIAGHSSSSL